MFFFLCRLNLLIDHGKLKVRGRKKKKKYTPKNGRTNIAIIAAADATSRAVLLVTDSCCYRSASKLLFMVFIDANYSSVIIII
jgi:hypothetical protein